MIFEYIREWDPGKEMWKCTMFTDDALVDEVLGGLCEILEGKARETDEGDGEAHARGQAGEG